MSPETFSPVGKAAAQSKMEVKCPIASEEYPFFLGPALLNEYRDYQKNFFDMKVMLLLFSMGNFFFVFRCNVFNHFNDGFYFSCSFLCTLISLTFCCSFISAYLVKSYASDESSLIYRISYIFLQSRSLQTMLAESIPIFGTLGVGFGLFARVMNGACIENVSLWDAQRCNPAAKSSSLPQDHVMFLFLLPIYAQSMVVGMTFRAVVICWFVGAIAVVFSLIRVDGRLEIWSMMSSMVVVVTSYRYEKLTRLTFVNNRMTAAAEKEKQRYILLQQQTEHQLLFEMKRHELEIVALKAEEECRLMEQQKKQMVALIGNIAHDLKTPLQSFLVDLEALRSDADYCEYLNSKRPDDADSPRSLLISLQSTCRFMSMAINRSIDFAKASRNIALVPQMETFALEEDMLAAINVIRHLKSSTEILVTSYPTTMCRYIITDKHWFAENILCLLSNAVKYSNGGAVTVRIEHIMTVMGNSLGDEVQSECDAQQIIQADSMTSCLDARGSIMISIEDEGIGIPQDARSELFQPFKQVQRLAGGTGLGLYSLSNRIEALKGSRGVSSRRDGKKGSVFWFAIPYRPDPHTIPSDSHRSSEKNNLFPLIESRASLTTREHIPGTPEPPRLHFLLVDDSSSILKVVGRALKNKKFDVDTAENGSAGLDLLIKEFPTQSFDVVLMDLQMPVMDGIEAVRRYRDYEALQNSSSVPSTDSVETEIEQLKLHKAPRRLFIIGMSANSDTGTEKCARDVGMDAFLPKPFAMADLMPLVNDIVRTEYVS